MGLGFKLLRRDPGVIVMFIFALVFMGLMVLNFRSAKTEGKIKTKYKFFEDAGLASFQVGMFLSIVLFACFNITFGEFFKERRNKMFTFWKSIGVTAVEYFAYYIIWNWIITSIFMIATSLLITMYGDDDVDFGRTILLSVIASLSSTIFGTLLAICFKVDTTAVSSYMLINSLSMGAIGALASRRTLKPLANIIPAGKLLDVLLIDTFKREQAENLADILKVQGIQILVYGILAILAQNLVDNEYGVPPKNCLFRSSHKKSEEAEDTQAEDASALENKLIDERDRNSNIFQHNMNPDQMILQIANLKKSFNSNIVLNGVNLSLNKGEISCLLGANGAGKTTLFNIILDHVDYESGEVSRIWGNKQVSFCPQEDIGFSHITVEEHIEYVLSLQRIKSNVKTTSQQHVDKVLDICDLKSHWDKREKELSGGYKRRLTIGMALLGSPDIILMDEPTTALDMEIRYNIMKGFERIRDELGTTILYTTHHLDDAENFSDRIMMLAKGKIIIDGSMEQLRSKFNMATLRVSGLDSAKLALARDYFAANFDQSNSNLQVEDDQSSIVIRLPFSAENRPLIDQMLYFESELGACVELRQTSLEEVYLMEGEVERYSELDKVGKTDLSATWAKLLSNQKKPGFFSSYFQILKKSTFY